MALLDICDKISNSLDNRENCIGIYIDLSKAFDTIDHAILLDKLEYYGIHGNMITYGMRIQNITNILLLKNDQFLYN